ncbi:MAG: ABC transporter permease subunit [Capsulimonadales bacterium]|nr:ABC transporter permease subunit [Capsulimonadales bacterium]
MSLEAPIADRDPSGNATIADTSYRHYEGPRNLHSVRFRVVALSTIRQNVNRTRLGFWIPAGFILLTYFIFGAIFYVTQSVRQFGVTIPGDTGNPYALTLYQGLVSIDLFLFAAALTVGAGSIAADNRANALLVYLSRPLTRRDYLLGKWLGIFLLLAGLSLVPNLVMYLFFLTAYWKDGFSDQAVGMFGRMLAASLIGPLLHTSLILGFSAWSRSPRLAGAAYAGFYFILSLASGILGEVLLERDTAGRMPQTIAIVSNLSVSGLNRGVAQSLYDVTPQQAVQNFRQGRRRIRRRRVIQEAPPNMPGRPPLAPMAGLTLAIIVLPVGAAAARIRAVEVVRG